MGEPLPNEEKQKPINWESDDSYEFVFDIALAPEVNFTLSADDKIPSYDVEVAEDSVKTYKSNMLKQFGKLENVEEVGEEDFIIADLEQGETKIEGTYITLRTIESKTMKKNSEMTEDEQKASEKQIQDLTDSYIKKVDAMVCVSNAAADYFVKKYGIIYCF